MQLNRVVLPAPLGPMRPTISHSLTRTATSESACRPPKRMETPSTSRTATDTLLHVFLVVGSERSSREPRTEGLDLLAHAARVGDQGEHEQQRADGEGPEGPLVAELVGGVDRGQVEEAGEDH